jgi:hypothetical protein
MSEVKNVRLAFVNEASGLLTQLIGNIEVDFIVIFTAEESGKTFRVRIDLFEERSGTGTNPPSFFGNQVPFFTFTYGFVFKSDYYTLVAVEGETTQSLVNRVNKSLNTNPNLIFDNLRNKLRDTPEFFYAVVTLSPDVTSSARSETVEHREF